MIRKNLLFCKITRIKTSSKSLFDSYMSRFKPGQETCPVCGSLGNCRIHAYYGRHLMDFISSKPVKSDICVLRVCCGSCGHTHAILPDVVVPYSGYSLFFLLRLLGEYFSGLFMSKNCVKDLGYHKTSSINGFLSGASISRNGSGCLPIWKSLTGFSLRNFCHTTGIPLSPWGMPFSVITHLCSPMPIRHLPARKPHNTISLFIPRISLYSDHTTMGWLWNSPCFMMDKTP